MLKTFIIKIPKSVKNVVFSIKYQILIIVTNSIHKLVLKNHIKIFLLNKHKFLLTNVCQNKILKDYFFANFNSFKTKFKKMLKPKFIIKLKLNGIGFKFFELKKTPNLTFLKLKIGYSHFVYYKIPKDIKVFFLKANYIILISNFEQLLSSTVTNIRKFKLKEPYKGKGIFYENESIKLKQTKT
jgi:ribosomal protein L6P/L9E